jgi:hypothetical protein
MQGTETCCNPEILEVVSSLVKISNETLDLAKLLMAGSSHIQKHCAQCVPVWIQSTKIQINNMILVIIL